MYACPREMVFDSSSIRKGEVNIERFAPCHCIFTASSHDPACLVYQYAYTRTHAFKNSIIIAARSTLPLFVVLLRAQILQNDAVC